MIGLLLSLLMIGFTGCVVLGLALCGLCWLDDRQGDLRRCLIWTACTAIALGICYALQQTGLFG